ncbi:MAG TPA: phosphoenolpyruvate--protein phosphotransferase [Lentisphaeria bacterium]|nr:MAG: phosphoenolpyruvate--protein phosphotransferase [Lentisphaerae bacterium GWF2_38_69]HBM16989.1 phosphoenolpyruvate--protein phosphotransferase [Lentisphaeria bacterium]
MFEKIFEISNSISDVIAKQNDYNAMLSDIVRIVASGLNAKVCSIYVYNNDSDELILNATYGLSPNSIGEIKMKPGEGLTGMSFQENRILNLKDPHFHPGFKYFPDSGEEEYLSFLAIPLNIAGRCLGVMVVQTAQSECFSEYIVNMAKTIGTQLANLLLNADVLKSLALSNYDQQRNQAPSLNDSPHQNIIKITGSSGNVGIAIGNAYIFDTNNPFINITHTDPDSSAKELSILNNALAIAIEKTLALEKKALSLISEADASIFHAHLLFLEDKSLLSKIRETLISNNYTVEFALKKVYDEYIIIFSNLKDKSFRDKAMDFKDVMIRLLETVLKLKHVNIEENDGDIFERKNLIIVAREMLPSALLKLPANVKGIICERGGATAHVSILAKALNIPALMSAKKAASIVRDNDIILMDCYGEIAYVNPPDFIIDRYGSTLLSHKEKEPYIANARLEARTSDGSKIFLRANIGLLSETILLNKYGAEGIGLYRTEFFYMIRDRLPTEEEQYEIFSKVFKIVDNYEVTIRTLDAGSDKPLPYLEYLEEENPALGIRGARLLLSKPEILKPHLKAILRAGENGKLNIMFPMVSTCHEIIRLKQILEEVKAELTSAGINYSKNYRFGIMIEVPSIIMDLKNVMREVDFISIGTNDLFQYLYAADRTNDLAHNKNLVLHPGFLRLLKIIGDDCKLHNYKKVSVCGDVACKPLFIPLIIGSAIHEMSMPPRYVPLIKETIRHFSIDECKSIMSKAIDMADDFQVLSFLNNEFANRKIQHLIQEKNWNMR